MCRIRGSISVWICVAIQFPYFSTRFPEEICASIRSRRSERSRSRQAVPRNHKLMTRAVFVHLKSQLSTPLLHLTIMSGYAHCSLPLLLNPPTAGHAGEQPRRKYAGRTLERYYCTGSFRSCMCEVLPQPQNQQRLLQCLNVFTSNTVDQVSGTASTKAWPLLWIHHSADFL